MNASDVLADDDRPIGRRMIFRAGPVAYRGLVAVLMKVEFKPNAAGKSGYLATMESEENGEEFTLPLSDLQAWCESL